jgi:hypothetical protein
MEATAPSVDAALSMNMMIIWYLQGNTAHELGVHDVHPASVKVWCT